MKNPDIRQIGLVANSGKIASREIVQQAAELIRRSGRTVLSDEATAKLAGIEAKTFGSVGDLTLKADLLLVFGGDGTLLRVAREMGGSATPILGINLGGLGFLTAVPSTDLEKALNQIFAGQYTLEPRAMLEANGQSHEHRIHALALNDIVISRAIVSRLIELEVFVNNEMLTRFSCDGLIVSSPTGSTAYSLSAGGAILSPTSEVFAITPICPHTLSNRSVIVRLDSIIHVRVINQKPETILSADGQGECELAAGDVIDIRRSKHNVNLLHLHGASFFETLQRKLQWRGSNVGPK